MVLTGKHIDHSIFGKIFLLMPVEYIKEFNRKVSSIVKEFFSSESVLIADSTGIELDRIYEERIHKGKKIKAKQYDKLHILTEYYFCLPDSKLLGSRSLFLHRKFDTLCPRAREVEEGI